MIHSRCIFLSTLPARGATDQNGRIETWSTDFYPRSPRGERHYSSLQGFLDLCISIHAPREGSDPEFGVCRVDPVAFLSTLPARGATTFILLICSSNIISIHAPREGSDLDLSDPRNIVRKFLSTLPARGATSPPHRAVRLSAHFYPRSPRGERPGASPSWTTAAQYFYPRSPRGERRRPVGLRSVRHFHFYPRSPRGERPDRILPPYERIRFLSTLPARGATRPPAGKALNGMAFLSTLPARGATYGGRPMPGKRLFLSTLPARGATPSDHRLFGGCHHFYPRSPRGERQQNPTKIQLDFAQKGQMRTLDAQNGRANFVHSV